METSKPDLEAMMAAPDFEPEQMGARFWYEQYLQQRPENAELRTQLNQLQAEVEQLKETLLWRDNSIGSTDNYVAHPKLSK